MLQDILKADSLSSAQSLLNSAYKSPLEVENFIGNELQSPSIGQDYVDVFEPKTGKLFAQLPNGSVEVVDKAVQAATNAFSTWSKTPRSMRSQYLQKIANLLTEKRELFAVWESIDQGKTVERARIEIDRAISNFRYFSTYMLHEETSARVIDGVALTYEHRSPAGVFALISPWNMPLYLLTWKIAPCIAFGCTCVAKPSEVTSMTAYCKLSLILPTRSLTRSSVITRHCRSWATQRSRQHHLW